MASNPVAPPPTVAPTRHEFDRSLCFDRLPKPVGSTVVPVVNGTRDGWEPPSYAELYAAYEFMTTRGGGGNFLTTFDIQPASEVERSRPWDERNPALLLSRPNPDVPPEATKRFGFKRWTVNDNPNEAGTELGEIGSRGVQYALLRTYTFRNMIKAIDPNWLDCDEFRSWFGVDANCGESFAVVMPAVLISLIADYAWSAPPNAALLYVSPALWSPPEIRYRIVLTRSDATLRDLHPLLDRVRLVADWKTVKPADSLVRLIDRATARSIVPDVPLYGQTRSGSRFEVLPSKNKW